MKRILIEMDEIKNMIRRRILMEGKTFMINCLTDEKNYKCCQFMLKNNFNKE